MATGVKEPESALRIQLEGGLETVETLVGEWEVTANLLREDTWWHGDGWPVTRAPTHDELEALRVLEQRATGDREGSRLLRRWTRAQKAVGKAVRRRLAQLGIAPSVEAEPAQQLAVLQSQLPFRYFRWVTAQSWIQRRVHNVFFFVLLSSGVNSILFNPGNVPRMGCGVVFVLGSLLLNRFPIGGKELVALTSDTLQLGNARFRLADIEDVVATAGNQIELVLTDGRLIRSKVPNDPMLVAILPGFRA